MKSLSSTTSIIAIVAILCGAVSRLGVAGESACEIIPYAQCWEGFDIANNDPGLKHVRRPAIEAINQVIETSYPGHTVKRIHKMTALVNSNPSGYLVRGDYLVSDGTKVRIRYFGSEIVV